MPFLSGNTSRPSGGGFINRIAPGYTWGQRLAGLGLRLGGSLLFGAPGAAIAGRVANSWDNAHNPNTGIMPPDQISQTGLQGVGDLYNAPSFGINGPSFGSFGGGDPFAMPSGNPSGYGNWGSGQMSDPFNAGGQFNYGSTPSFGSFDNSGGAGGARGAFTFGGYGSQDARNASMDATQSALRMAQAGSRHADGGNRIGSLLGGSYTQAV